MNKSNIRCIFFDLGKVLVDLDYGEFRNRMISLTGLEIDRLRAAFAADGAVLKYELGFCSDEEFLSEINAIIGVNLESREFHEAWTGIFADRPILSDALLLELSKRHPLWVISNTNRMHFQYICNRFRLLRDYFQGWILSYEVGAAKPDPAIYQQALNKAGITAAESLFIDDRQANVESALKLGMDAFQFQNPDQLIRELESRRLLPSGNSEHYR